jgi:hypothetical protein
VRTVLLGAALLLPICSGGEVRAQEYIPPPIVAPPPYQPFNYQLDRELAARGRRNKIAGAVMMAVGSATLAAGQLMVIWAGTHPHQDRIYYGGAFAPPGSPATQTVYDSGMIAGGAVLAVAGFVTTIVGIPVYAVGGSQMRRAQFRVTASDVRVEF